MNSLQQWVPGHFRAFESQAAGSVLPMTACMLTGHKGGCGLPARSAWVLWRGPGGALCEVVAAHWVEAPLVRIYVNHGFRRPTKSLAKRLGCTRGMKFFRADPALLTPLPIGEITCLQEELPLLAALAAAMAAGKPADDLATLPGSGLLDGHICSSLYPYHWTRKAWDYYHPRVCAKEAFRQKLQRRRANLTNRCNPIYEERKR